MLRLLYTYSHRCYCFTLTVIGAIVLPLQSSVLLFYTYSHRCYCFTLTVVGAIVLHLQTHFQSSVCAFLQLMLLSLLILSIRCYFTPFQSQLVALLPSSDTKIFSLRNMLGFFQKYIVLSISLISVSMTGKTGPWLING